MCGLSDQTRYPFDLMFRLWFFGLFLKINVYLRSHRCVSELHEESGQQFLKCLLDKKIIFKVKKR